MSFLAPLFLLGGLALAGPLIFHLIRRHTRERVRFGSLMFLQPTPPRLTERRRLEHWLLLLLRLLALAFIAFAFARPWWRENIEAAEGPAGAGQRVLVLLDVSASLHRGDLWEEAKEKAFAAFDALGPADSGALMTFAQDATVRLDFNTWRQTPLPERRPLVRERLAQVALTWGGTALGSALRQAAEQLSEVADEPGTTPPPGRLVVVSDFQEGSRIADLQGFEWPQQVKVVLEPVGQSAPANAGVQLAADGSARGFEPTTSARVRVSNTIKATQEIFQLGWMADEKAETFLGTAQDVTVAAGQQRIATVPWPEVSAPSELPPLLQLRGDHEPFDNTLYVLPPATRRVPVVHFGSAEADDQKQPLFFLKRALPDTAALAVEVEAYAPDSLVTPETLKRAALVFVTGSASEAQIDALRGYVQAGQTAVVALTSLEMIPQLARLSGVAQEALGAEEIIPPQYAMWAQVDLQHPLLAPFAEPRFSDFTKIRFWKYRRLNTSAWPGARVLASFDSGAPALLEVPVGRGRLVVLTAGWHPADSQLALSTKFPPLLASLLEWVGGGVAARLHYVVGEAVLPSRLGFPGLAEAKSTVIAPDGTTHELTGDEAFTATQQPGFYQIVRGEEKRLFAINLDPAESRTAPLPFDELERLGVPLAGSAAASVPAASTAALELATAQEAERRQQLWRWLLAAALGVLILETWLAGFTARHAAPQAST